MLRSLCALLVLLLPWLHAHAQKDQEPFQERITQLWDLVHQDPDTVLLLADALYRDAEKAGSYKGMLNAIQLKGESHYMMDRLDSAFFHYTRAMDLAEGEADRNEIGHTHTSLAGISADRGQRDVAIEHFEQSLRIRMEDKDSSEICDVAVRYANCLGDGDMPGPAMRNYLLGLKCCRAVGDDVTMGHAYNGMAIVHKKQKNFEKALELLDSAEHHYAKVGEEFYVASVLNNRGVLKKQLGRYAEAAADYEKGLATMESAGYERGIMSFHQNLGILANLQQDPDQALAHCGRSLAIARTIDIPMTVSEALNEIAKAQLMKGMTNDAEASIDEAIAVAQDIRSLEKEHQAWETKSRIHQAQGRADLALTAYQRYVVLNDSMFRLEKTAEIDRLQTEFESERKDQHIADLQERSALVKARNRWLRIGIAALALVAVLIVVIVLQKRRKDMAVLGAKLALERAEKDRLDEQLDHKRRELTAQALHLAQKNELLQTLKEQLAGLPSSEDERALKRIGDSIRFDERIDQNWDQFTKAFTETNAGFFDRLRAAHPDISKSELRLAALLSMNLNSKEIGAILNISDEGVRKGRYRLRKKLGLETSDGLEQHLATL